MTKEDFQKTIWYRLLKVIFIFVFLGGLIFIFSNGWDARPLGHSYYEIRCANGKVINADLKPDFKLSGERVDHGNIRCSSTQLTTEQRRSQSGYVPVGIRLYNDDAPTSLDLKDLAYTHSTEYMDAPITSWLKWLTNGIMAFLIWILFLWVIERVFYYISFGERVFRKPKKLFD